MSNVVIYDPADVTVANRVTDYLISVNTPDYSSDPNALINPDLTSVIGVNQRYWKVSGGTDVVEMTTEEKNAIDAELATPNTLLSDSHSEEIITNNTVLEELYAYTAVKLYANIYTIQWTAEVGIDTPSGKVEWAFKVNGESNNGGIIKPDSADEFVPIGGAFEYSVLTEGDVIFSIDIASKKKKSASKIRNISIIIRRKGY